MANLPRRFRLWVQLNGEAGAPGAVCEGVQFSDGDIVLQLSNGVCAFHGQTVEHLISRPYLFPKTPVLEWLDGAHQC